MATQIVTANRLRDGLVVYLDGAGSWSEQIAEARVALDDAAARELLQLAERREEIVRVVAPYLMEVVVENGKPRAQSIREAIRARGPTVRRDLGKQAESAAASRK